MAANSLNGSDTTETSSSDNEAGTPEREATDYEKHRQLRIADNKARMEALGLPKMAISLMGLPQNSRERKGKLQSKRASVKEEEDDDYTPNDEKLEEGSDEGFGSSDDEFKEKTVSSRKSGARSGKVRGRKSRSSKDFSMQKSMDLTDFKDEDEALIQAIALSLKDSREISDTQHCGSSQVSNAQAANTNEKDDNTRRRKRKSFSSRVQMTADDLIIHFCQLDEVGKGSITLRDLQRMAAIHDFTWTDEEVADMIRCFDSDKDGKLTLDDFRNIVMRGNLLPKPENA